MFTENRKIFEEKWISKQGAMLNTKVMYKSATSGWEKELTTIFFFRQEVDYNYYQLVFNSNLSSRLNILYTCWLL